MAALFTDEKRGRAGFVPADHAGLNHAEVHPEREGRGRALAMFQEEDAVHEVGEHEVEFAVAVPIDGVRRGRAVLVDRKLFGLFKLRRQIRAGIAPEIDVAVKGTALPFAFLGEGVVPTVVTPITDAVQDVDTAVAVPIDGIPEVVAADVILAGQVNGDGLGELVALEVVEVTAAVDEVQLAIAVEVGDDGVLLRRPPPDGAVVERLGVGAEVVEVVDAVEWAVRAVGDEVERAVAVKVEGAGVGVEADSDAAADAGAAEGDSIAGADHGGFGLPGLAIEGDGVLAGSEREKGDAGAGLMPVHFGWGGLAV